MAHFTPLSDDYEALGIVLMGTLNCINAENIRPYLEKHGLDHIDPNAWYPYQRMLNVYNDMLAAGSHMFDFVSIGMKLAEVLPPTPGNSFRERLGNFSGNPSGLVRASDYGYIRTEFTGEKSAKIFCRQGTPDDLLYGMFYGLIKRDLGEKGRFTLKYDNSVTRRDDGGDHTVFIVEWN